MKMNATKLTIALVALLLALTCVFAACGKKNNTDKPDDTTPVDNTPVVDTVAKEDLNAIAENLKAAYVANYVDLYAPATANEIEAAKSAALINIFAATSKEEAQKVADDFIAYLKSQKTIIDTIAALVEKIGDVSLKDADALNELTDVVATLDAAYAGTNTAKKAALDAYKADAATQKTIKDIVDRYNQLKAAKKDADVAKGGIKADGTKATDDGLNLEIAALKAKFTEEGKEFLLADFGEYEALLKTMAKFAKEYDIVVDSEPYADVFDTVSLKAAKAALDAAFGEDSVLTAMLTIVDQAKILEAAADEAQWREYIYVDADPAKLDVKDEKDATYSVALNIDGETKYGKFAYVLNDSNAGVYDTLITLPDGAKKYYDDTKFTAYATEDDAKDADVKKIAKVEATITLDYKLTLKAAVETAVAAVDAVMNTNNTSSLEETYKYGKNGDPVKPAVVKIRQIASDYEKSVKAAYAAYKAAFGTNANPTILGRKTNVALNKADTLGTYALSKEADLDKDIKFTNKKAIENQYAIYSAIKKATKNFTAQDEESGALVSGGDKYLDGFDYNDYAAIEKDSTNTHGFNLVNGVPTISYTAWTYRYQLEEKDDLTFTTGPAVDKFNALYTLADSTNGDSHATLAKAALRFLAMYIGDGDYADSYDFTAYKKYEKAFTDEVLYMVDRDITEVAVPVVVKIRGEDVNVAKDETDLGAKFLSPYTVAKALVAEEEKINAAKKEAVAELSDAALALKAAGEADAIQNVRDLYDALDNGKKLNEKLEYGLDYGYRNYDADVMNAFNYLKVDALNTIEVKVRTKPSVEKRTILALLQAAEQARKDAKDSFNAIEANVPAAKEYVAFATLEDYQDQIDTDDLTMAKNNAALTTFAKFVEEAKRQFAVIDAGVSARVLNGDLTDEKDTAGNYTKKWTEQQIERLTSMEAIFSNYATFYSAYTADSNYIKDYSDTTKAGAAANADFTAYLKTFKPADTIVDQKAYDEMVDRMVAIVQASDFAAAPSVVTSKQDNARLSEDKKNTEKSLKKDLANYETKILASYVFDAGNTKLDAAAAAISNFASDYFAEYVNLKVSYVIGTQTFEFDYLTETFKNRVLYNSQSVIQKVLDYADTVDGSVIKAKAKSVLDDGTDDCWKATVSATIDGLGANFSTVTSITAAETAVTSSTVADSNYKYDNAKNLINSVGGNNTTTALIKEYVRKN